MKRRAAGALLPVLLAACSGGHDPTAVPAATIELALSDTPIATIGAPDEREGYAIGRVADAAFLVDRVVLADGIAHELRFYDFAGVLRHTTGSDGAGPGEYRSMSRLHIVGDSAIAVWDPQLSRVTIVSEHGTARTMSPLLEDAESMRPPLVGVLPSGIAIFRDRQLPDRDQRTGPNRDTITYFFVDAGGRTTASYRTITPEEFFLNERNVWGSEPLILGGELREVVVDSVLLIGESNALAFRMVDEHADSIGNLLLQHIPERTHAAAIEEERQKRLEQNMRTHVRLEIQLIFDDGSTLAQMESSRIAQIPAAGMLPAFSALYPDVAGFWYCRDRIAERPVQCTHVADGAVHSHVEIPDYLDVQAFRDGHVLVSTRDELDRAALLLFRLRPARD